MPTWHGHPTLGSFEPSQPLGWEDICPRQIFCTGQLLHSRQDQGALRRAAPPCGNPPLPGACRHQEAPIQADIPDKGACHRSCQQDEQNTHRQPPLLHSGGKRPTYGCHSSKPERMNRGVDHSVCYTPPPSPMGYIGYLTKMYNKTNSLNQYINHSNPAQKMLKPAEKAQTFEKMFTTPQSPAKGERKAQG